MNDIEIMFTRWGFLQGTLEFSAPGSLNLSIKRYIVKVDMRYFKATINDFVRVSLCVLFK